MVTNNWVKRLTMEHIRCKNNVGVYIYIYYYLNNNKMY